MQVKANSRALHHSHLGAARRSRRASRRSASTLKLSTSCTKWHTMKPLPMLRLPVWRRTAQARLNLQHAATCSAPLAPQAGAHQAASRATAGLPVSAAALSATAAPVTAAAAAAAAASAAPPAQSVAADQGVQGAGAKRWCTGFWRCQLSRTAGAACAAAWHRRYPRHA